MPNLTDSPAIVAARDAMVAADQAFDHAAVDLAVIAGDRVMFPGTFDQCITDLVAALTARTVARDAYLDASIAAWN